MIFGEQRFNTPGQMPQFMDRVEIPGDSSVFA